MRTTPFEYRDGTRGVWKNCITCGREFCIRSLQGRNRLYCSDKCRPPNPKPTLESQRRRREKLNAEREAGLMPPERHGTLYGYTHWCCKCGPCRGAFAAYRRQLRARKKQADAQL